MQLGREKRQLVCADMDRGGPLTPPARAKGGGSIQKKNVLCVFCELQCKMLEAGFSALFSFLFFFFLA